MVLVAAETVGSYLRVTLQSRCGLLGISSQPKVINPAQIFLQGETRVSI